MSYDIEVLKKLIKDELYMGEVSSQFVSDLESGALTILKLIENLGDFLTSQDVRLRRGGVEILSNVLGTLSPSFINAKELEYLVSYYTNCLIDHHSFIPAVLRGLLALANMNNLPDGVASKIFTVLNLNFTCQSQPQADRYVCYQLLNTLMERKPKELQDLGPDFVCGYLSTIDSERDPRNLMYLFQRLPTFYQNFPPGHLLEDAFDTVSCYFPVDFRTNPNDPRGISREDLSAALMPCLVSIDDFCPFTVALALDKLMSDLKVAKIDSLLLLKRAFSVFSTGKLCPLMDEIASTLLNQLKPGVAEFEVQELCIDALKSLIKYLWNHERIDELKKIMSNAFASVEHFLCDLRVAFFKSAVKFLAKIASVCDLVCGYIITTVTPKLLSYDLSSHSNLLVILESFKLLLFPCLTFNLEMNKLVEAWPQVTELFLSSSQIENAEVKISAVDAMTNVARLFSKDERKTLHWTLCRNIKFDNSSFVRQKCVDCLRTAAIHFPIEVQTTVDEEFFLSENGDLVLQSLPVDAELIKRVFHCWCYLAPVPGFLHYLERPMKKYIVSDKHEYAGFVIEAFRELVMRERDNIAFLHSLHHDVNIIRHLMDWWHEGCNAISDDRNQVFEDERVAENLEFIICIIVRVLDEKSQLENAVHYLNLTTDYRKRFMNSFQYLNDNDDLSTPKVHCSLSIVTFEGIVNALLPAVLDQTLSQCLTQIIKYLSTLAVYCSRPICCTVACRSMATIFNKIGEGPCIEEQIEYVFAYASTLIENKVEAVRLNAIKLMLCITKSLLLKGYRDLNKWLDKLLNFIANKDVSSVIADGFRDMCRKDEYFLKASCHCTMRLFYRQRLFSYVITKLVASARTADEEVRIQCAASAVYLLEELPQTVIAKHFTEFIPLLVELLNTHCRADISLIALQKLASTLPTIASMFEEHVETFLSKLLPMARSANSMKVRMAALRCVAEFAILKPSILLPHKIRVVHELAACLDDSKRLVRKEAVRARTRWMVLGIS